MRVTWRYFPVQATVRKFSLLTVAFSMSNAFGRGPLSVTFMLNAYLSLTETETFWDGDRP